MQWRYQMYLDIVALSLLAVTHVIVHGWSLRESFDWL